MIIVIRAQIIYRNNITDIPYNPVSSRGNKARFQGFLALRELHGTGTKREIFEKSITIFIEF